MYDCFAAKKCGSNQIDMLGFFLSKCIQISTQQHFTERPLVLKELTLYPPLRFSHTTYNTYITATTSCKISGDTSPSWGVINLPFIFYTTAPLPPY